MGNGLLDAKQTNNDDLTVNDKYTDSGLLGQITRQNQPDLKNNNNNVIHRTKKGLLNAGIK